MKITQICRILAWLVVAGALALVLIRYEALPTELPVTRWTTAPKTLLLALRVPGINLLSLVLLDVLLRATSRTHHFGQFPRLQCVLLGTVTAKAGIEAAGLLLLPSGPTWLTVLLAASVAGGLVIASVLAWPMMRMRGRRQLAFTSSEKIVAFSSIAGILLLNLPLIAT